MHEKKIRKNQEFVIKIEIVNENWMNKKGEGGGKMNTGIIDFGNSCEKKFIKKFNCAFPVWMTTNLRREIKTETTTYITLLKLAKQKAKKNETKCIIL